MNKKIWIPLVILGVILTLGACGGDDAKIYDYDLSEYVTVGDYKEFDLSYDKIEVTQDDLDVAIGGILAAAAKAETITNGVAEDGDKVNIDYSGTLEGKAFEGGTAAGQDLILGSGSMIPGFEEQIVGNKIGSTFTIDVKFPEVYQAENLQGKEVQFEITINSKEGEPVMPEFNENFVKNNSQYSTVEEYMKELNKNVYEQKEAQKKSELQTEMWAKIIESSEVIKLPEVELQRKKDQNFEYYESYATYYEMEFTEFLDSYLGMSEEEFADYVQQQSEVVCKQEMVLYTIARNEGIEVSKDEYEKGLMVMLEKEGFSSMDEFEEAYGEPFEKFAGKENIIITLLLEKTLDWLVETNISA
jgi:trigger factor